MLTHVRCRWLSDEQQKIPLQECRTCSATGRNPCGYPLPLIQYITRDRDPNVVQCSATMLEGCPREQGLKKHLPYSVAPDEAYTRAMGSLVHDEADRAIKESGQEHVVSEERYRRSFLLADGREAIVTAQLDALYPQPDGTVWIQDYKKVDTLSDSGIDRKVAGYVPQFSIQRWILDGMGIVVSGIDLIFLHHRDRRVVNLYPHGEPDVPSARLMTLEQTESYLQERLPALVDSLEGRFAPPLTDPRETWKCLKCDVREECNKLREL